MATCAFFCHGICRKSKSPKTHIEESDRSVKGVASAIWDVVPKKINVESIDKLTNPSAMQKSIAMVGHNPENVKADAKAYNALPDCCKYRN